MDNILERILEGTGSWKVHDLLNHCVVHANHAMTIDSAVSLLQRFSYVCMSMKENNLILETSEFEEAYFGTKLLHEVLSVLPTIHTEASSPAAMMGVFKLLRM